jgi:Tol biopolymer transport system component
MKIRRTSGSMNGTVKLGAVFILVWILASLFSSCDFSIDEGEGRRIVIDSVQVYLVNVDGGNVRRIADGEDPLFIPNTNRILYRYYDKLYTIGVDDSIVTFVANAPGNSIHLYYKMDISPDGAYVAFPARKNGIYDLYLATLDGRLVLNLTNSGDRWEEEPRFYSNGNRIAFFEYIYPSNTEYLVDRMNLSSIDILGNRRTILLDDSSGCRLIGETPDGKYLVAQGYEMAKGTTLYFIDQNRTSNIEKFFLTNEYCRFSAFIPANMKIFYSTGESGLYTFDIRSRTNQKSCEGPAPESFVPSHDGGSVLMVDKGLEVLDLATGNRKRILPDLKYDWDDFSFSPDDKKIVFVRHVEIEIL